MPSILMHSVHLRWRHSVSPAQLWSPEPAGMTPLGESVPRCFWKLSVPLLGTAWWPVRTQWLNLAFVWPSETGTSLCYQNVILCLRGPILTCTAGHMVYRVANKPAPPTGKALPCPRLGHRDTCGQHQDWSHLKHCMNIALKVFIWNQSHYGISNTLGHIAKSKLLQQNPLNKTGKATDPSAVDNQYKDPRSIRSKSIWNF